MPAVLTETTAVPAVTAQDLALEHAELLPARETLLLCKFNTRYNPGGPVMHYHPDPPAHVA